MIRALIAASFDPITNGHVDLIRRASRLFDELIVAVYAHPKKNVLFALEERVAMVQEALVDLPNIRVSPFAGLLVDYAREVGAKVLVRGLRATSDFDYEFQITSMYRKMEPELEVMFFLADIRYTFLSSSIVKEIAELGGDVSDLVPSSVLRRLGTRFAATTVQARKEGSS
jgi:pantetheine-phosphate adenylyltransferase